MPSIDILVFARFSRSVQSKDVKCDPRVHDLRHAELVDRLVQCLDAELDLQRVGDAPGQNLAGEPVQNMGTK